MPHDGGDMPKTALIADILGLTAAALPEVTALTEAARAALAAAVTVNGKVSASRA